MVKCIPTRPKYFAEALCTKIDCKDLKSRDFSASRQDVNLDCMNDCQRNERYTERKCAQMCVRRPQSGGFDNGGLYKDPRMG